MIIKEKKHTNNLLKDKTMAKLIERILNGLRLTDEDDEFEDDFDTKPEPEKPIKKETPARETNLRKYDSSRSMANFDDDDEEDEEPAPIKRSSVSRQESRTSSGRIPVQMRSASSSDICVFHPKRFEDAQEICDMLKASRVVFLNFDGIDDYTGQRIMDFIGGTLYALEANIHQVSVNNFIISPQNVEISGDYIASISGGSFEVPTLSGTPQNTQRSGYRQ